MEFTSQFPEFLQEGLAVLHAQPPYKHGVPTLSVLPPATLRALKAVPFRWAVRPRRLHSHLLNAFSKFNNSRNKRVSTGQMGAALLSLGCRYQRR